MPEVARGTVSRVEGEPVWEAERAEEGRRSMSGALGGIAESGIRLAIQTEQAQKRTSSCRETIIHHIGC